MSHADVAAAAWHWIEDVGLLATLGSVVLRRLAAQKPQLPWVTPPIHVAAGAALGGGFLLLLHHPSWPVGLRVGAEGAAFYLCLAGGRFVAPPAVLAAVLLPFSGHAAALPDPGGPEFADALHVLSAAIWAGGILALATLSPPGGWAGAEARLLLERFGRIAVIAFGVTALTGVLRATEQLAQVSDLWRTAYGVVLTLKAVGVLAMLALSLAWRRGLPASRLEAGVATSVVLATGLLAGLPPPV